MPETKVSLKRSFNNINQLKFFNRFNKHPVCSECLQNDYKVFKDF